MMANIGYCVVGLMMFVFMRNLCDFCRLGGVFAYCVFAYCVLVGLCW